MAARWFSTSPTISPNARCCSCWTTLSRFSAERAWSLNCSPRELARAFVVTSRAALRLTGEQELPVPPLPIPDRGAEYRRPGWSRASQPRCSWPGRARSPLVSLPTGTDAAAVVGIVRRLDGLPLAIELAAARTKLLTPSALLDRLDHSLGLLVGGSRDLPDRQQTLRSTIAWSHDLLGAGGRRLFAALAVFRGGAGLDDVEAVCEAAIELGVSVVDAVQELLDQSHAAPVGAVAATALHDARDRPRVRRRKAGRPARGRGDPSAHAHRFAALCRRLERPPVWPGNDFLALLDRDHDNLRAALDWLQDREPGEALRMAAKLTAYWSIRGHFGEGRRRLHDLLGRCAGASRERVAGLNGAGWLALDQGDVEESMGLLNESVELARAIGDRVGEGTALMNRGRTALGSISIEAGGRDITQALAVLSEVGDRTGIAGALMFSGLTPQFTGDVALACANFASASRIARSSGCARCAPAHCNCSASRD